MNALDLAAEWLREHGEATREEIAAGIGRTPGLLNGFGSRHDIECLGGWPERFRYRKPESQTDYWRRITAKDQLEPWLEKFLADAKAAIANIPPPTIELPSLKTKRLDNPLVRRAVLAIDCEGVLFMLLQDRPGLTQKQMCEVSGYSDRMVCTTLKESPLFYHEGYPYRYYPVYGVDGTRREQNAS